MAGNVAPNTVTNGLVLYLDAGNTISYPGTGTTWRNLSGNNNNGTLTNGPTFNTGSLGNIVFDGVDDYAGCGTFTGLGSSSRTIEVWCQILSLSPSGNRRVFTLSADEAINDTPAYTIGFSTTTASLGWGFGGPPYNGYVSNQSFALSTWMCLVGSINVNTMTAYKDNSLVNTVTNTGTVGTNPIGQVARYNAAYSQYGNVRIGNIKIYNRALSSTEITQNYNALKGRYGL